MVEIEMTSDQKKPVWLIANRGDQIPGHFHYRLGNPTYKWRPPTDVFETEEAVIVRVEIAGMREAEFTITLNDRSLLIQGMRPDNASKRSFHQMEIRYGEFSSEVELHWTVDSEAVTAEYKDGILQLLLPKAKTHQIEID